MRAPARIPIVLEAVRKAWEQSPDLRLGQLISNATPVGHDVFSIEDDELFDRLTTDKEIKPNTAQEAYVGSEELETAARKSTIGMAIGSINAGFGIPSRSKLRTHLW